MTPPRIVTAALPYANGSLHIGHLLEYCQADMYTRALNRLGENALYICASDSHGTPIELNAQSQGIPPETLVQKYHDEHQDDFIKFDVRFDHFGLTHNPANKELTHSIFAELKDSGNIFEKEIDGNWCNGCERFLPDRFVKGTCPKCDAEDQYGDVCEQCGSTHSPTELKDPFCATCTQQGKPGKKLETRRSKHLFFKLSSAENTAFLKEWLNGDALQKDVANYVRSWVKDGLQDWCISRDGPYFGFEIPEHPNKFFYVWLDAPIGYIAATKEWAEANNTDFLNIWKNPNTTIEHFIGKDIIYFHTLFWPAVLNSSTFTLPKHVHVHGMLTVDGKKMSKSRGTFISAADFAANVEPQALRYYFASKDNGESDDLDLSVEDFVLKINSDLVNKHTNLFSRAGQFLLSKLDGKLGDLPFAAEDALQEGESTNELLTIARQVVQSAKKVEGLYRQRKFSLALREITHIAEIGNEFMQNRKPWDELKSDPEKAKETITMTLNICHALAMYLWPIVPRFADDAASILNSKIDKMDSTALFQERLRPVGEFKRLFERIEKKAMDKLITTSQKRFAEQQEVKSSKGGKTNGSPSKNEIQFSDFQKVELKTGKVLEAEPIAKSDRLLKLQVDVGAEKPRQIVAGIKESYSPEDIIGRTVVVVTNLASAKLMGVESQGMLLAANGDNTLTLVQPDGQAAPGTPVK